MRSDADLAEQWLDTGGLLTVVDATSHKQYPKRSELRRAEARATNRRSADRRPAGGRPPGGAGGGHRPPSPSGARVEGPRRLSPYSNSSARLPVALAPRPATLPIPQTATPSRPAGIDLRLSPQTDSPDAFHAPTQTGPMVPIAVPSAPPELAPPAGSTAVEAAQWGLDLRTPDVEPADLDPQRTRRKPGRSAGGRPTSRRTRVARMLVLALVVGAEGVALTTMTGTARPLPADAGTISSAFELANAQGSGQSAARGDEAASSVASAALLPATATAATAGGDLNGLTPAEAQRDSSAGKVSAAIAQAKAAADRIKAAAARRADILRDAQSDPKSVARMMLTDRGWGSSQYSCLNLLWTRESGWNYRAYNAGSGAYGIPQALPGSKMGASGSDWRTNPVTQIRWGLSYISSRYGTPCGAWAHSSSTGWY